MLSSKEGKEFQEGSQGWGEHTQEGALLPTAMGTGQGVPIYGCEQGSLTVSQPDQVSAVVLYAITGQTQSTVGDPERACVAGGQMPGWCAGEHLSAGLFLQLFLMPVCCIGAAVVFIASTRLGTSTPGSVPSSASALCLPTHPLSSPEPQNMLAVSQFLLHSTARASSNSKSMRGGSMLAILYGSMRIVVQHQNTSICTLTDKLASHSILCVFLKCIQQYRM